MSLFRTTSTATPPTPPELDPDKASAETDTDTDTPPETKTDAAPEVPVVRMPDGTEMPADVYAKSMVNEELAKVNTEWSRVREMSTKTEEPPTTETPTKSAWEVEVSDDDFQSDVEKSLVNSHNQLGTEFGKVTEEVTGKVSEVEKEVAVLRQEQTEARAQREIEQIEQKHGVTEAELKAIYNEYGGAIESVPALAEIAVSRKAATEKNDDTRTNAQEQRREAAAKISGGGNAQPKGNEDPPPKGRGLTVKDRYNGAAIAAKYSAFGTA